ncbi:MAG: carboxypeptidase-like regulatory domain-containing protein [Flavobacteriaceae bacterium]|nr:carboxypeptidase-like regulatory domain-containing protein [Flavobacteriaceae bacterium]
MWAQEQDFDSLSGQYAKDKIKGQVINAADDVPIYGVHIINTNKVKGAITDNDGNFELLAEVNDTLYFTYLGLKPMSIKVTEDWKRFGNIKIKMTEMAQAMEDIDPEVSTLTGYLEIDARSIPVYNSFRYSISGLAIGYEAGYNRPGALASIIGAIFNPTDFLYRMFNSKADNLAKLRAMKADPAIRSLLQNKYDRLTLLEILQLDRIELELILNNCNYSLNFINEANDLQVLDGLSECWEEYKILQRNRKSK